MEKEANTINCPHCGKPINVSTVLFHQVQEQLRKDFEAQIAKKDSEFKEKEQKLIQEKEQLTKAQEELQEKVASEVKSKLAVEKATLEKILRKKIDEDKAEQLKAMEDELNQKSEELKGFNKLKADVAKLTREKEELRATIEAESETKLNELLAQEKEKITTAEAEKAKLDVQKRDKLIEDLTKRLDEAQKKLELGSSANKLVGEVTEQELRDFLRAEFPFDMVEDVPSGIKGADVIQNVRNNLGTVCGTILYERKQTMNFSEGWLDKLVEDGRTVNASALVLVTSAFPKDQPESHLRKGVWVCHFDDLRIIVTLTRDGIVKTANAMTSQQNKGTKMELLYEYLVSAEFAGQIKGLLESFRKMDKSLAKEKEDSAKKFAEREAHIWQAKKAILGFYGKIEGIAADGLNQLTEQVKMLEKPTSES